MQITRAGAGICAAAAPLQLPGRTAVFQTTAAAQASAVFTAWSECLHSRVAENKPGSLTEVPQ